MNQHTRTFIAKQAVRESVPLLIGLTGPSGGGKTFSALRLATGIQKITGGDIFCIDTEARRALHYADRFKFQHIQFDAPFGSLDYRDAIKHCVGQGAKVVIIDSMSHEHEGSGGVLEFHDRELDRLTKGDNAKRDNMNFLAWAKPKAKRREMINDILQLNANFIFCFRAKEKLKIVKEKGKNVPRQQGFMPIAGEELVFEMTVNCLLLPHADGVPTWQSDNVGERLMMKLPEQFKQLFAEPQPLSETMGETLARWSKGDDVADTTPTADHDAVLAKARQVAGGGTEAYRAWYKSITPAERAIAKTIGAEAQKLATAADQNAADDDPFAPADEAPPELAGEPISGADNPTDEPDDDPLVWTQDACRAFGRGQLERGMSRKAAVPPALRDDKDRTAAILAGFDEAKTSASQAAA